MFLCVLGFEEGSKFGEELARLAGNVMSICSLDMPRRYSNAGRLLP